MPIGATAATLIGAGVAAAGQVANIGSQVSMNKKTQRWNEKMYQRQLEDNLRLNSPRAQMQRFQEAGLNPHLIYGQGNVMDVPKPQSWNPTAPTIDPSIGQQIINSHYQNKATSAQTNLTQQALELQKQDLILKQLDAMDKILSIDIKGVDRDFKKETYIESVQMFKQNLLKLTQETDANLPSFQTQNLHHQTLKIYEDIKLQRAYGAKENQVAISQIRAQTENEKLKSVMMHIENKLAEQGIFKSDPIYLRIAHQAGKALADGKDGNYIADLIKRLLQ